MHKSKSFRPWQPGQTTLLPPSPSDWLSDDHQEYFLLDLVDELDLSAMASGSMLYWQQTPSVPSLI